jgi:hypothetical protein
MTRPRWPAAGFCLLGFVTPAAADPIAQVEGPRPPVVVELDRCDEDLAAEVRRIVGVELRAAVVDSAGSGEVATRVAATCRGSTVDLRLSDGATARRLERAVELSEAAPTDRARLLALAVAELVVASWHEIESETPPAAKPSPPAEQAPAATLATTKVSAPRTSAMLEIVGAARTFPGSALWLAGAGVRAARTVRRPLVLTLELTAEWGTATRRTGQVAARAIGGALSLGWGVERSWVFMMPWVGVRGGMARLQGEPSAESTGTSGETQSGLFLGPELGATLAFFPRAVVHATVALSAGTALIGVQGEVVGDSNVDIRGPWAALVVGAGLGW